jgi:endoglucanase
LKKSGNRIVDKNGDTVKLNGLSMFWDNWAASFWNGDVVKYLVSNWKINLVRCAMGVSNDNGPVGGGYLQDPNGNKAKVSTVVDAAIETGIYVIIDWHVEGRCNADQAKPFFAEMAQKYGQYPNIIWETCNEPHGWGWGAGLKSYHEQVVPVIRQHSSNLIVAGTNTWSQDVDEASRDQLSDSNVAYTLHFYSSMHKQRNRDKASAAMSNGAAIFVTEWGVEQNGEGNSETNIWLNFLRQHGISNAMWGIYDKDSEAWAILHHGASPRGGWSDGDITNTGHFAKGYFLQEAGGGPAPPGPSPPAPPSSGCCSWDNQHCGGTTDYCKSQATCENNCKGKWIHPSASTALIV